MFRIILSLTVFVSTLGITETPRQRIKAEESNKACGCLLEDGKRPTEFPESQECTPITYFCENIPNLTYPTISYGVCRVVHKVIDDPQGECVREVVEVPIDCRNLAAGPNNKECGTTKYPYIDALECEFEQPNPKYPEASRACVAKKTETKWETLRCEHSSQKQNQGKAVYRVIEGCGFKGTIGKKTCIGTCTVEYSYPRSDAYGCTTIRVDPEKDKNAPKCKCGEY